MRNRSLSILITLVALTALLSSLVALASTPSPAGAAEPPGLHHVTDWRTYSKFRTPADPINIAIYGPGSFDVQHLQNVLETAGWADAPDSLTLAFTYSGDGLGLVTQDFSMWTPADSNGRRLWAAFWASHTAQPEDNGFTFFATASEWMPCRGGLLNGAAGLLGYDCRTQNGWTTGRNQLAAHIAQVFQSQGWQFSQSDLTGVGTTGIKIDDAVSDGHVTVFCVDIHHTNFCPAGNNGNGGASGGQPPLSVAFDHDTYQGASPTAANGGNPVRLAPGQTSAPIVAYFRNTSPTNTLYRANVVLASYLPDDDQPAPLNLCDPASARQCSPITMISLDHDCPPQALCSFTYTLRAPTNFTGTETLNWRVMVIHPDGSFDGWLNDANNHQQLEFYDVVAVPGGGQ